MYIAMITDALLMRAFMIGDTISQISLSNYLIGVTSGLLACNWFGLLRGRANYSVPGLFILKSTLFASYFIPACKISSTLALPLLFYAPIYLNLAEFFGSSWMHFLMPQSLADYVSGKLCCELVKTAEIREQCIIAIHPHAILPLGGFLNTCRTSKVFDLEFEKLRKRLTIAASSCFIFPFYRELLITLGIVDCSRTCAERWLSDGYTLCVFPGGAREGLYSNPDVDWLDLKRKTGFIRLALQAGVPVVPAFTFNEVSYVKQLDYMSVHSWSFFRIIREQFQRTFGLSLPIPYKAGFDFQSDSVPISSKLVTVVGSPIKFPRKDCPTETDLHQYMEIYSSELTKLYNKHAEKFNTKKRDLIIS